MLSTPTPSLHRFDAYRLAVEFRRVVVRWLPLRRSELSDQLDRASISVPLNVAEGAGRSTSRERAVTTPSLADPRSSVSPALTSSNLRSPPRPLRRPARPFFDS
jgi:23S rRNA-intervening sequence protein